MTRKIRNALVNTGTLVLLASTTSCSDEATGKPTPNEASATKPSQFGLKVLVTQGSATKVVRVVPSDLHPAPPR